MHQDPTVACGQVRPSASPLSLLYGPLHLAGRNTQQQAADKFGGAVYLLLREETLSRESVSVHVVSAIDVPVVGIEIRECFLNLADGLVHSVL